MTLFGPEHYDLMKQFEATYKRLRLDHEPKDMWAKGHIYQNGTSNDLFLAYRNGYTLGRCVERLNTTKNSDLETR